MGRVREHAQKKTSKEVGIGHKYEVQRYEDIGRWERTKEVKVALFPRERGEGGMLSAKLAETGLVYAVLGN
ncbi:unnamed protein product [Sphenostylis stenocarpa]|uniref:Uncharacterized protein n=1 Tax=Sphenostylis stenocarpa TaxID=92480 RepID=A0AA86S0N4_9FABA|nr:unnamed protein product [Sphenostylis stenocarpa]